MKEELLPTLGVIVELSTRHLAKEDGALLDYLATDPMDPKLPDVRALKYAEGWFVWVLPRDDGRPASLRGFSEGFRATLRTLFDYGARYVRLDADAPVLAGFRKFDW